MQAFDYRYLKFILGDLGGGWGSSGGKGSLHSMALLFLRGNGVEKLLPTTNSLTTLLGSRILVPKHSSSC